MLGLASALLLCFAKLALSATPKVDIKNVIIGDAIVVTAKEVDPFMSFNELLFPKQIDEQHAVRPRSSVSMHSNFFHVNKSLPTPYKSILNFQDSLTKA